MIIFAKLKCLVCHYYGIIRVRTGGVSMDYLVSLEKAIEYIEQHLDEELFSEDIAKAGGC